MTEIPAPAKISYFFKKALAGLVIKP